MKLEEIFAARRPPFRSGDEIDESIRRQRDEWHLDPNENRVAPVIEALRA